MQRTRFRLPQKRWGTLVSKYPPNSPQVGPDDFTANSKNFDTDVEGVITKRLGDVNYEAAATTGTIKDAYEAVFTDGVRHSLRVRSGTLEYITGGGSYTSVRTGYSAVGNFEFASYLDRVYLGNGIDNPQVYDRTTAYGSAIPLPATITIVAFGGLAGDTVTLAGTTLTEGVNWTAATSNDATATSLAAAIDALAGIAASAVGAVITITSETPYVVRASDNTNMTLAAVSSPRVKDMGAQAPASALTAAEGAAGNLAAGTYLYKVTFLYYDFEESNPGPASGSVTLATPPSQMTLTSIPIGGYGVTARKIYRSNDGGTSYTLVQTIANNTATTATDNAATGTTDIPSDNGVPRNFSLIVQAKDRNWVAGISGDKSDLDYSAAGFPDIFPTTNTILCNPRDPITGLVVFNDRVVVFNRNSFGQILGTDPSTFRYAEVPGNVGCVDNRTIQVRTLRGVPTLLWLSDRGFYMFNGSTVEYISDEIEDLVNFNIQQASQVKGAVAQSSQAAFQAGTYTGGIDLTTDPGAVTTPNPKYLADEQTDWEAGSTVAHIVTRRSDIPGRLAQARRNTFTLTSGSNSGTQVSGSNLTLPVAADHTGAGSVTTGGPVIPAAPVANYNGVANKVTFTRAGTITQIQAALRNPPAVGRTFNFGIWSDAGGGVAPINSVPDLYNGPGVVLPADSAPNVLSQVVSVAVAAGQTVWVGWYLSVSTIGTPYGAYFDSGAAGTTAIYTPFAGPWATVSGQAKIAYTFTQTAIPASGTWTGVAYDSGLFPVASSMDVVLNHSATYPAGTTGTTYVDQADSSDMVTGLVSQSVASLNGNNTFTFAAVKRHWRVRVQLTTTDDRSTPTVSTDPTLRFPTSVTWIGPTADGTTDTSAMNQLVVNVESLPAGTTVTAYVQKSTLPSSGFADEYSQALSAGVNTLNISGMTNPTLRYNRVKLVFDNASDPTASAVVTSALLKWTITANFYSSVVDTGATPAGWDVFQASVTATGGGVTFGMRADTVSANLTDDVPAGPFVPSFTTVTNGSFPTGVTVARYAQWKVQLVATADAVPSVDSVTINWFISSVNSIRAASIFLNKSYYVSLAETGQTTNNLVLKLDQGGNWRVLRGLSVGTLSFFFTDAYYSDAGTAQMRRFMSGTTDHGNAISLDVRFKAFDFDDMTKRKVLRSVYVVVGNTGATYTVDYSVDNGENFLALNDSTGATSFTVSSDGGITTLRLVPVWPNQIQGKTLMVRIREATTAECEIHEVHMDAYVRKGEILNG